MKTSLIQKIKNRAKSEKISFDAAAEKYFFEALSMLKKNTRCVHTGKRKGRSVVQTEKVLLMGVGTPIYMVVPIDIAKFSLIKNDKHC